MGIQAQGNRASGIGQTGIGQMGIRETGGGEPIRIIKIKKQNKFSSKGGFRSSSSKQYGGLVCNNM